MGHTFTCAIEIYILLCVRALHAAAVEQANMQLYIGKGVSQILISHVTLYNRNQYGASSPPNSSVTT